MDKLKMETPDLTQSNIEKLNISDNVIKETAKRQPLRAVFRDSNFADSPAKINVARFSNCWPQRRFVKDF